MRHTPAPRSTFSLAVAGILLLILTSCSVPGFGPDPDDAADRLAKALTAGDLKGVDFFGGNAAAAKEYAAVTDDVGDAKVSAGSASADGDSATARLDWRWQVGSKTWSYDTEVKLTQGETSDGNGWLVRWSPTIVEPSLTAGETLAQSTIKPERGEILGAGDEPIVTQRPVLRVGLDKSTLKPAELTSSATALARLLDIGARDFVKQVTATGPKAFVLGIVYRRDEAPAEVMNALSDIPGARSISDHLPLAPTKDFASAILGTVGPATAELVKDSDGRIKPGDDVGVSGLQKRYDEQLSGVRGATVVAVDDKGERRTLFTADAEPGKPLRTTLDAGTQLVAQRVLAGIGPASALVAIRPSSGDLLPWPAGRARRATTPPPSGSTHQVRRSRWSARWHSSATA